MVSVAIVILGASKNHSIPKFYLMHIESFVLIRTTLPDTHPMWATTHRVCPGNSFERVFEKVGRLSPVLYTVRHLVPNGRSILVNGSARLPEPENSSLLDLEHEI